MSVLYEIVFQIRHILLASAFYILLGLFVAALIHIFISAEHIAKYLGRNGIRSVLYAALFGIPLPLCSCSVVPTALSLRKKGASRGAVGAFLVATPESGVDSISATYALMNPAMAIARPVAAFLTAVSAGIFINLFDRESVNGEESPEEKHCCHAEAPKNFGARVLGGFHYAFVELLGNIAVWFAIGIVLAGLITALIPANWIAGYLGGGLSSMLIMLLAGIPLYICATSSTPVAAALILKGMSPGAVLVFLLAGPATNAASLTVLAKVFGKRFIAIYLLTIAVVSVACGLLFDQLTSYYGWSMDVLTGEAMRMVPYPIQVAAAVLLVLLMVVAGVKIRTSAKGVS